MTQRRRFSQAFHSRITSLFTPQAQSHHLSYSTPLPPSSLPDYRPLLYCLHHTFHPALPKTLTIPRPALPYHRLRQRYIPLQDPTSSRRHDASFNVLHLEPLYVANL